ncbi:MAG TPA: hypothetical protein PKE26_02555 [Kiritimatiellia bacterium]|nr:hypothetical protein [Kiritimatiellia bacterium]HMO97969.1 hypothetical protein [Kiritimatiellia bacterium]HMP95320.1 hypothetical protein [Kiritimatiellia bacterium]
MKLSCLTAMAATLLLVGCATGGPKNEVPDFRDTDPMIAQLSSTARQAFDAGEVSKAVVLYRRALDRSRAMDNSREIGRNAYNLAISLMALEDWDGAARLLMEAERETLRAGDDAAPILLLAAELARLRQDPKAAEAALDRLERGSVSDTMRGQAYVLRANLACDRGDASRAEGFLQRARGYLRHDQDPGLAAGMAHAAGRIAIMKDRSADAAAAFDLEAGWLQRARRLPEMADALERAGQQFLLAGQVDAAADRFYRSARSWMAQGHYVDALRVIELAAPPENSSEAYDEETLTAIMTLFDDIRRSVEQQSRAGNTAP